MKSNIFLRFVTNNHRFKADNTNYSKAYFVNVVLLLILLICTIYIVPSILFSVSIHIVAVNIASLILALTGLIYFHKTDQVTKMSVFSLAFLVILIFYYTAMTDSSHHFLYWLVMFPPIIFFILGHDKAKIVSFFYICILAVVIAIKYKIFDTEVSDFQSFVNIVSPTIFLVIMINFYEKSRSQMSSELELRNNDLAKINSKLSDNKEKLEIILGSTEEGVYGVDLECKCIFCNKSGLEFLGYNVEMELLGKNMHEVIHSKYKDGSPMRVEDCKIYKVFKDGKGVRVLDEVFWKKDGTYFYVEYAAYPQFKGDKIVGGVITFRNITQEKEAIDRIHYLNTHDWLTGLNNRSFFDKSLEGIDKVENLPISVLFADINGLKLTNDIYGHSAGDELLIKGAELLKSYKCEEDILARVGGDEFILLLPKTNLDQALKIEKEIQNQFASYSVNAIPCSIAIGTGCKSSENQELLEVITNAEGEMYKEKTLNRQNIQEDIVDKLIELLHEKSPREKAHSENVMKYSALLAMAVNLSITKIAKLKNMAYFHDIGKLVLEDDLLKKDGPYTEAENIRIRQHPAVAYRILNLFDKTLDIAPGVYAHHENWDGSGYPRGLKGEEIPYKARILSIAEVYDYLTNRVGGNSLSKAKALAKIEGLSGSKLDPDLTSVFIEIMKNEKADMSYELSGLNEEVNKWEDMM